ncbi:MAG: DALR anticodon-binding domain-containing protein, partial [Alphaproteobacteria bacterium]
QELFPQMVLDASILAEASFAGLEDEGELNLIKRLADWPRQLEAAALAQEPHRLAAYLYELAQGFHTLWSKGKQETILRFLIPEDRALSEARMALVSGVLLVIRSGLRLFGVKPVEEMRA